MQRVDSPSVRPGTQPSWWLQEALRFEGEPSPAPPLQGTVEADVAIAGGGYTGLWTALLLCERAPALRIALIESEICGAGASGKNGGFVHGYWSGIGKFAPAFGDAVALEIGRLGTRAQDALRAFCTAPHVDVWWREKGIVKIACSPAQDASVARTIATARRLGVAERAIPLSPEEVQARCRSPRFRGGVFLTEGANLQPARLARALRAEALRRGVAIFERSPALRIVPGTIATAQGEIRAKEIVLATNAEMSARPHLRRHLTNFSSFMVITEPVPERLAQIGWTGGEGLDDARMFVHYFRTTPDGRVAMGSGSGPLSYDGRITPALSSDAASAARAETALRRLLPGLGDARVTHAWGGAIDVAGDGLPFFGTFPEGRIHYGCGYSGHGVNATWIGGQILASMVLREDDEWTRSPFVRRNVPALPPEPLRFIGGTIVRASIVRSEEAEEDERRPPLPARIGAAIPRLFGLRVGTR
ncbi:MAG: FAD-dependent oxidoreductase [Candidatus Eremiobacteraeota bacterium]|nr:FAD-dependent oxidoreductase [Candidatus Eremiobacteraeota bacterium]